jgi:AcrR family transcriptional regulator
VAADTRTALLDAAERLVGDRGLEVSLREVGAAAGQRNNSAAQYHFGSRAGLMAAVFERRMGPINESRQAMLDDLDAAGRGADGRALVEALVWPLTDAVGAEADGAYARFLSRVIAEGSFGGTGDEGRAPYTAAYREVRRRLGGHLGHVPPAIRPIRLDHAVQLVVHSLAAWEHSRAAGRPLPTADVMATDLTDCALAVLDAPSTAPRRLPATDPLELAC